MNAFIRSALLVLLACFLFAIGSIRYLEWYLDQPGRAAGTNPVAVILEVRPGDTYHGLSIRLSERGLIGNAKLFRIAVRYTKAGSRLKTGEYEIRPGASPRKILAILSSGKSKLYPLTIPEGYRLTQIATAIEAAGFATAEAVMEEAGRPERMTRLAIPTDSMEGYLYPDTYLFPKSATVADILDAMAHRFETLFPPSWRLRAEEMGFSVHGIVTLASIIEKETAVASERPVISSVFHNRLERGMRLETDPTVIYGIQDYRGNIRKHHLREPTPYNTYVIRGLPPGPIASPGKEALKAALWPQETDYLFFVARNDGTHQFSTNIRDHNRAVRKYQLRR